MDKGKIYIITQDYELVGGAIISPQEQCREKFLTKKKLPMEAASVSICM
jgi:hypothetical protein